MAGKISDLTATESFAGELEILQGGGNYRFSVDKLRRNLLLRACGIAKALAGYQRDLDTIACGFKASGDADATSANGAVDTAAGAWKPSVFGVSSNTSLLLNFEGADASTTFTDQSPLAHTVSRAGDAQIDTAQFKFGSSALLLDGTGDNLTIPDAGEFDFGTGDFTVDFWARWNSNSGVQQFINGGASGGTQFCFRKGASQTLEVEGFNTTLIVQSSAQTLNTGTWYHLAVTRASGTMRIFLNGTSVASGSDSTNLVMTTPTIGRNTVDNNQGFNGWLDAFRVQKGVAEWSANFTPPTTPYGEALNGTLITPYQTADAARTKARAIFEIENVDAATLGTDWTVELTCNGGTNWTAAGSYTDCGLGQSGRKVIETDLVTCTSGTSFAARVKNLNQKRVNLYKAAVSLAA